MKKDYLLLQDIKLNLHCKESKLLKWSLPGAEVVVEGGDVVVGDTVVDVELDVVVNGNVVVVVGAVVVVAEDSIKVVIVFHISILKWN